MTWIGTFILDDAGNPKPADTLEWGKWFDSIEKRRVAETWVIRGVRVSTVFLGLDHSFTMSRFTDPLHHEPVLWETMIFGGRMDQYQERYTSLEAAKAGHEQAVAEARKAEAGFKAMMLRRRDELVKIWGVVSWLGFTRWYKRIRNKLKGYEPVTPSVQASQAMDNLIDRRNIRTAKQVAMEMVKTIELLARRRKFKDD